MSRLVAVVLALALVGAGSLHAQPEVIRVWNVSWADVSDRLGNHRVVPILLWAGPEPRVEHIRYTAPPEISVVASLDEQFRTAKLSNNTDALAAIVSDDFLETDQNGNRRDKTELIGLFRIFTLASSEVTKATVRSTDHVVTIVGEQTDVHAAGTDHVLFTRIYAQAVSKEWKLLASTQVRKP